MAPALSGEDFEFVERLLGRGTLTLETAYRAMSAFEAGGASHGNRLAPWLVHTGRISPEALYEALTSPTEIAGQVSDSAAIKVRLLDQILRVAMDRIRADQGTLLLVDDNLRLQPVVSRGRDAASEHFQISSTILNHVIKERATVVSHDAAMEFAAASGKSLIINRICSVIVAPLLHRGAIAGVLWLHSASLAQFRPDDALVATTVAELAVTVAGSRADGSECRTLPMTARHDGDGLLPRGGTLPGPSFPPPPPFGAADERLPPAQHPPQSEQESPGTFLGAWRIDRAVASGGMSTLYAVEHSRTTRRAVAKVLHPSVASNTEVRTRFIREARVLASLRHDNLARVLDAGAAPDGRPFIVMERLHGESLAQLLTRGALRVGPALRVARQILAALSLVHARGIVHRDVKPDNVFLPEAAGLPLKLLDFGIAKGTDRDGETTQTGAVMGTPVYMPPEQIRGDRRIDARADLYSLGIALYEMLCGRPPFWGEGIQELILKHLNEAPAPLVGSLEPLPPALCDLVLRMLAKDPDDRPASCEAALAELDRIAPDPSWIPPVASLPTSRPGTSDLAGAPDLGAWRAVRRLESGGLVDSWEVVHVTTGLAAFAEVIRPEVALDASLISGFIAGHRAVAAIDHPNVIGVLDLDQVGERPFAVLELVPGESVDSFISRSGRLDPEHVIAVGRQLAGALRAVHSAAIVHRSISSNDVILCRGEPPKAVLAGFEIALVEGRGLGVGEDGRPDGHLFGVITYMAPEQARARPVDERCDVYALGMTLSALLLGDDALLPHGDISVMLVEIATSARPAVHTLAPWAPAPLADLIDRMVAFDPQDRPSAAEVLRALDELAEPHDDPLAEAVAHPASGALATVAMATLLRTSVGDPASLLAQAGLLDVHEDGQSQDGLPRFRAVDGRGPVTAYVVPRTLRQVDVRAGVEAMRFLLQERLKLFVPIADELALADGSSAILRRDPIPPVLVEGVRWAAGPAVAITAVAHRALATLKAKGRRFDTFTFGQVRAQADEASSFSCLLQPPRQLERDAQAATMAGGEFRGDPHYFSPGYTAHGREVWHDAAYAAGILLYTLLAGAPPLADARGMYELGARKVSEDPRSIASHCPDLDPTLATWLDRLIARNEAARARAASAIEAELLACLDPDDPWHETAVRYLADVSPVDELSEPVTPVRMARPIKPSLAVGERVSVWTVVEHVVFGGEAEIYRVRDAQGQRAILKLWYETERCDPFSPAWRAFRRGMLECSGKPGFPRVFEPGELARGSPRPYIVLEEVTAPVWRERAGHADRPAALDLLETGAQLLDSVAVAHDHFGVVSDLSARNVLLRAGSGAGEPVLLDIASPWSDRRGGTPGYVAPEVAEGASPDARSDLFSAGVLLTELALGSRMYAEYLPDLHVPRGGFEAPRAHAVSELRSKLGEATADAIASLLSIDPVGRPSTAGTARGCCVTRRCW